MQKLLIERQMEGTYHMNWQDVLTSVIVSFVLNGVVMLILKSKIEAAHDRDMATIQQSNAKELAKVNCPRPIYLTAIKPVWAE